MEMLYSIFIGIIFGMNVGMIDGIGLLCRRDTFISKKCVAFFSLDWAR